MYRSSTPVCIVIHHHIVSYRAASRMQKDIEDPQKWDLTVTSLNNSFRDMKKENDQQNKSTSENPIGEKTIGEKTIGEIEEDRKLMVPVTFLSVVGPDCLEKMKKFMAEENEKYPGAVEIL